MGKRNFKQAFILLIFLGGIFLIGLAIYFVLKPEPTCYDRIINQGEQGVDCGGPCFPCPETVQMENLQVVSADWVYDIDNKYDIVVKINNPNELYGAESFDYKITIHGPSGEIQSEKSAQSFVLPGKNKYLIAQSIVLENDPSSVDAEISNVKWTKFSNYEEPNLIITKNNYEPIGGGAAGFSRASGTLVNESGFDFETIVIKVILRDESQRLLAVSSQQMNTVRAKEHRDYNILFSHGFPGSVSVYEVEPEVNVFNSENYIRIIGNPERWDER